MDENQQINPAGGDSLADRLNTANPETTQGGAGSQNPSGSESAPPVMEPQTTVPTENQQATPPVMEPQTTVPTENQQATPPVTEGPSTFSPAGLNENGPVFSPETNPQTTEKEVLEPKINTKMGRSMWWLGGIIIGVVILALLGYFVVYPMLSSSNIETPIVNDGDNAPVNNDDSGIIEPSNTYESLFLLAPSERVELVVGTELDTALLTALFLREGSRAEPVSLMEIVFKSDTNTFVSFAEFLSTVGPSSNDRQILFSLFEENFTSFVYKDGAGLLWPGYIATIKPTADPNRLSSWFSSLEIGQLQEYFLVDPGTFGEFKNGEINGIPDRYAPGSTTGASFSYLASGDKILISTSFDGMKEAVRLMGLTQ